MTGREPLAVWLYDTKVATLVESGEDKIELSWTGDAYDRWGGGSRVLSHLLPIDAPRTGGPHPARVKVFLDGLLPEGHARTNYALEAGIAPEDTFKLVTRYGRDTAGALVFQSVDEPAPLHVGTYRTLSADEVGQRLRDAHRNTPTHAPDHGRDSSTLAGMQPKITLHRTENGHWQSCLDGAPSTWIIKVAQPVDSPTGDVVDTEVLSLDIARQCGIEAAHAEIHTFDGVRAIAVKRYDRYATPDGLQRIHQEDLAQAIGLNTQDPLRKFQRGNRMPALAQAAEVLRAGAAEPDDLLRLTTINYVLGNIDAHAKNISFLRRGDGTAVLAPAYDIAMHTHHTGERLRSALDINGKIDFADIDADDLVSEARSWGVPTRRATRIVSQTIDAARTALVDVDRSQYPGVSAVAYETVLRRSQRGPTTTTTPAARRPGGMAVDPAQVRSARRGPQARVARGVPAGGRYTPTSHAEADVTLVEED